MQSFLYRKWKSGEQEEEEEEQEAKREPQWTGQPDFQRYEIFMRNLNFILISINFDRSAE